MNNRSTRQTAEPPNSALGRRRLVVLLGIGMAGALCACGKKGPLRLPEPTSPSTGAADEETK